LLPDSTIPALISRRAAIAAALCLLLAAAAFLILQPLGGNQAQAETGVLEPADPDTSGDHVVYQVAVDMDISGNTLGSIQDRDQIQGSLENCASVAAPIGTQFTVDVVLDEITPDTGLAEAQINLNYDGAALRVVSYSLPGGQPLNFTGPTPPNDSGLFTPSWVNFGPIGDIGNGEMILARVTFETKVASGYSLIYPSHDVFGDYASGIIFPQLLVPGHVFIDQDCADLEGVDAKVQGLIPSGPPNSQVGQTVTYSLESPLHNNGPDGPIDVDGEITVSVPPDCTVTPSSVVFSATLPVSVTQSRIDDFDIECAETSLHTFSFCETLTVTTPLVMELLPANNSGCRHLYNIRLLANADLKVAAVVTACDGGADVGEPFDCTVEATLHNNGPTFAVADVEFALPLPVDCKRTPNDTQSETVELAVSANQTVEKSWTLTCSKGSNHTMTGNATVSIAGPSLYSDDPDDSNNTGMGADTVPVFTYTDVKAPAVTVDYPSMVEVGEEFEVSVTVVVHNNGPFSDLQGEGGASLALPPDCVTTPDSFQLFNPISLPVSVVVEQTKTWTVTCSNPGIHQAIGCGRAGPVTLHVKELSTNNASASHHFTIVVGDEEPAVWAGVSCSILGDPPEVCGNGIDDDYDGLVDEEPDLDGDGLNDCDDPDADGDGWGNTREASLGTDPWNDCAVHPSDDSWPPDFDNNRTVNIADVLALKPAFGQSVPPASPRFDLQAGSGINIADVLALKPAFGNSCS
jgi:hypothetical protein